MKTVIVYGAMRSGTTLFRLMADGHPSLDCRDEADFLFDHLHQDETGAWILDRDALSRDKIYLRGSARFPENGRAEEGVVSVLAQLARGPENTVLIMLHRGIEKAREVLPDVPVIHILRDPRDVGRSSIGMGWAGTAFHGVGHWIGTEEEWDLVAPDLLPAQLTELRYESLIKEPEAELQRICEFIGVDYTDQMMNYADGSTYSKPDVSLIEQWRTKMSPKEVALVEYKLGEFLPSRGYRASGHPVSAPNLPTRVSLFWRNKRYTWGSRFARYGFIDPLLVALARRLNLPGLGRSAKARIDEKSVDYLK